MSTLCSGLWFAYGITLNNVFIYLPNGIGLILSLFQLLLFLFFSPLIVRNSLNGLIGGSLNSNNSQSDLVRGGNQNTRYTPVLIEEKMDANSL